MAELVRRVIPRRYLCALTYGGCRAGNCQIYEGMVEYVKGYLGCPSRMPEKALPLRCLLGGHKYDVTPTGWGEYTVKCLRCGKEYNHLERGDW